MNSLLRRVRPSRSGWVCRRCYSTTDAVSPINGAPISSAAKTPARTRFAPSPTGFLHLGGLRTALYNYLLAKNTGGQFILRIEDTDQKRTVPGAEKNIMDTLRWAGMQWDEGPDVGGEYGPYRQSERTELHRSHAQQLLANGHAYRCFCGTNRLAVLAAKRQANGMPIEYDRHCYNIPVAESDELAARGDSHTIRLKAPAEYPPFYDVVYGSIRYTENLHSHAVGSFEDPILLKSDGMPTYHLANVIDDHYMRVTHVLRASEWMPSTPKHMHLYSCFGWTAPIWSHVGLLQDKTRTKLSKRNDSVMVRQYFDAGYTAEALNNFVALLGWSHGGEGRSDVLTMENLIESFTLEGLTQGNTVVDFGKLDFLQKHHVRQRVREEPAAEEKELDKTERLIRGLYGDKLETGAPLTRDYLRSVLRANLGNYLTPEKFAATTRYFFQRPAFKAEIALKPIRNLEKFFRQSGCSVWELYHGFIEEVEKIPDTEEGWTVEALKQVLNWEHILDSEIWSLRMRLLRVALTDGFSGPGLGETMYVLGKQRCIERMKGVAVVFNKRAEAEGEKKAREDDDDDDDSDSDSDSNSDDDDDDDDDDDEEGEKKKSKKKPKKKPAKKPEEKPVKITGRKPGRMK